MGKDTGRSRKQAFWRTPFGLTLCVFLAVAAVLLALEHRAHLLGAWPLLFLILCVGMHFFMHGGHDGHGTHGSEGGNRTGTGGDDGR